jgi:hypothetical protein
MSNRGWLLLFVLFIAGIGFLKPHCFASDEPSVHVFRHEIVDKKDVETCVFTVNNVDPGSKQKLVVTLLNFTNAELEFLNATAGCKCTTVNIPKTTMRNGEHSQLEFVVEVPADPIRLRESYIVTINTKGARRVVQCTIYVNLVNVVSFGRSEASLPFDSSSKELKLTFPILCSGESLLESVEFQADDVFNATSCRVVKTGDACRAELTLDSSKLENNFTLGEVHLVRDAKRVSTMLLTLRKRLPIEITPDRIIFASEDGPDGLVKRASAIVRDHALGATDSPLRISCISTSGKAIIADVKPLPKGIYRVVLTVPKGQELERGDRLVWTIVTSDGRSITLESSLNLTK